MTTKGRKLSEAHVAGNLLPASASTVSQGLVPKHSTRVTTGRRDVSEAGSLSHSFLVEHSAHRTSNFLCYKSSVQRCWSRTLHRSPTQRFVVQSTRYHLNKSIECFRKMAVKISYLQLVTRFYCVHHWLHAHLRLWSWLASV